MSATTTESSEATASYGSRNSPKRSRREAWTRRGPLLPALVFTIIVTQIPFLITLAISALNWNIQRPGEKSFLGLGDYQSFAGLDNFATVFTDDRLRAAVVNTVVLTASTVVISPSLMPTIPLSIASATRSAREMSRV